MKQDIHPTYHRNVVVTCACGNTFVTGSTIPSIRVEICSACHPFYTGEQKYVDTEGRVERYQRLEQTAKTSPVKISKRKAKKKGIVTQLGQDSDRPTSRSLKQMIEEVRKK